MPHPYSLLGIAAATGFWVLAGLGGALRPNPSPAPAQPTDAENPMALRRSPYGCLLARLMKDSMHEYWHAGHASEHPSKLQPLPPAQTSPRNQPSLDWAINRLAQLDEARMHPVSNKPLSKAHRNYLDATANWHLRVAYRLDPGDAALYEISHYAVMTGATRPELARLAAERLAARTIEHALSDQGGLSAALTGAGAAINLLNNDMVQGSGVENDVVRVHWGLLSQCLQRYRALRLEAVTDGWWEEVPPVRRAELVSYAALVEKLAGTIKRRLCSTGAL